MKPIELKAYNILMILLEEVRNGNKLKREIQNYKDQDNYKDKKENSPIDHKYWKSVKG